MNTEIGILEQEWQKFQENILGALDEEEYKTLRMAFFAGAMIFNQHLRKALSQSGSHAATVVDKLTEELNVFIVEKKAEAQIIKEELESIGITLE